MFDPLSLDAPYDCNTFLNNLQAYNNCVGNDEMLDLIRAIQESEGYYWQGLVFPTNGVTSVGAGATLNGSLLVPQGTYITSLSFSPPPVDVGLYKIRIWDKGSKASLFYGDYCLAGLVCGNKLPLSVVANRAAPTDVGMNADTPHGQGYLMSPFIVTSPGVLGWEIVNMSATSSIVQVLMNCAVPINKQSLGLRTVDRGY